MPTSEKPKDAADVAAELIVDSIDYKYKLGRFHIHLKPFAAIIRQALAEHATTGERGPEGRWSRNDCAIALHILSGLMRYRNIWRGNYEQAAAVNILGDLGIEAHNFLSKFYGEPDTPTPQQPNGDLTIGADMEGPTRTFTPQPPSIDCTSDLAMDWNRADELEKKMTPQPPSDSDVEKVVEELYGLIQSVDTNDHWGTKEGSGLLRPRVRRAIGPLVEKIEILSHVDRSAFENYTDLQTANTALTRQVDELKARKKVLEGQLAEAEKDIACLLDRANDGGDFCFCQRLEEQRFTGISSDAMVRFAYNNKRPDEWRFPSDLSDLAACDEAMRRLPPHRQTDEVKALLEEYRQHVGKEYPEALDSAGREGDGS